MSNYSPCMTRLTRSGRSYDGKMIFAAHLNLKWL